MFLCLLVLESELGGLAIYLQEFGVIFEGMFRDTSADFGEGMKWITLLFFIALTFPNTQQIMNANLSLKEIIIVRRPYVSGIVSAVALYYVFTHLSAEAEFLYFNF